MSLHLESFFLFQFVKFPISVPEAQCLPSSVFILFLHGFFCPIRVRFKDVLVSHSRGLWLLMRDLLYMLSLKQEIEYSILILGSGSQEACTSTMFCLASFQSCTALISTSMVVYLFTAIQDVTEIFHLPSMLPVGSSESLLTQGTLLSLTSPGLPL